MRTVGQILKEEREKKFYSLDEIEKVTKIRKELLSALEDDDWNKLPPPTFVQGFIKNYAKFLGLPQEKLLAVFRRGFEDKKNPPHIMDSFTNPLDKRRFRLTPTKVISALVLGLVMIFFVYLWLEYNFFAGAPFLEVTQPTNQLTVNSNLIRVSGKTSPEAKVAINNQTVNVNPDGSFSQELSLAESANNIVVTSTSKSGQTSKVERVVFLKK